jgi:hypothetical protein
MALVLTLATLVPLLIGIERTPLPWIDEIMMESAAVSLMHGGPAVPTIQQAYPHARREDLFYGPVIFKVGAFWMNHFGVSAASWRSLSFIGGLLTILLSGAIVIALGDGWVVACFAMATMAYLPEMGSHINSGRFDTVTVALEFLALLLVLLALQIDSPIRFVLFALAGLSFSGAVLSTPRALLFCAGAGLGAAIALLRWRRAQYLTGFLVAALVGIGILGAWTASQGMTPVSWLRYLHQVSGGDKQDVSSLLGGTWLGGTRISVLDIVFPLGLVIVSATLAFAYRAVRSIRVGHPTSDFVGLVFLSVTAVTTMLLNFVFLARALRYQIFYIGPIVVVLLVASARVLRNEGPSVAAKRAVVYSWILLAVLIISVRAAKIVQLAQSWNTRNPEPISSFARQNIPAGATVLGSQTFYYYAICGAGANYVVWDAGHAPILGLLSGDREGLQEYLMHRSGSERRVYLIWPHADGLPEELRSQKLRLIGSFLGGARRVSRWVPVALDGYPDTDLYVVGTVQ